MNKSLVRTITITSMICGLMNFSVSAKTIELSKPHTGIEMTSKDGFDNVIKGCLITCGLDDIKVLNDASMESIVKDYEKETKLDITPLQEKSAIAERDLCIRLSRENQCSFDDISQFVCKSKIDFLSNGKFDESKIKDIAKDYNISLKDYDVIELAYVFNNIKTFKYDKTIILEELNTQLPKENIIQKILNKIL